MILLFNFVYFAQLKFIKCLKLQYIKKVNKSFFFNLLKTKNQKKKNQKNQKEHLEIIRKRMSLVVYTLVLRLKVYFPQLLTTMKFKCQKNHSLAEVMELFIKVFIILKTNFFQ